MIVPPNLDPIQTVESVIQGRRYHCADLVALDNHIRDLQVRIAQASKAPGGLVKQYKADIDALLERRSYMTLTGAKLPELLG